MNKQKINKIFFMIISFILVLAGIIFFMNHKQEQMEESYKRQNYAFNILGDFPLVNTHIHSDLDPGQYYSYDKIRNQNILYSWIAYYNYEINSDLKLEDIEKYLSEEYEENEDLRLSENYPEIQSYINFMWEREELEPDHPNSLARFNIYVSDSFDPYFLEEGIPFNHIDQATLVKVVDQALKIRNINR